MAKTQSQTGDLTIKKEKEEDRKPTLLLNGVSSTTRNKITKQKPSQNKNGISPTQEVKVEEDTDTKSLLQSTPNYSKRTKAQRVSQEQINRLTGAIVNDNMSINKAASKANISLSTGFKYYNLYKSDPDKKIPSPRNQFMQPQRVYTHQDIENLITYIEDDKMTISKASSKVNMAFSCGRYYYKKYLNDPDHKIPKPCLYQSYTQDQKDEFIGYIVNGKMSITAASKKAKMSTTPGKKYYHKYFNEQNPDIATPSHIATPSRYTQEQINELISYIVDDKMIIDAASRKANICDPTARKYYRQYLRDNNMELSVSKTGKRYTQNNINEFIGYIADDKMTIKAASQKANMKYKSGYRYYKQYLKDHKLDPLTQSYAQDKIKELIGYIVDDKMSITAASKKANMKYYTAYGCYRRYLKDPKHDVPT